GLYFEHALAVRQEDPRLRELEIPDPLRPSNVAVPALMSELLGNFVDVIRLLGRRTAELHKALGGRPDIPDFAPEPFTEFYRHSVYHGILGQLNRTMDALRMRTSSLPETVQQDVQEMSSHEAEIRAQLLQLRDHRVRGL